MPAPLKVSRDDWVQAALDLVAAEGFDALSVEGLAKRAGATKGSFYHHFSDRAALIQAVLQEWQQRALTGVITELDEAPTSERLAKLLTVSLVGAGATHAALEWAILAAADDPAVGDVVRAVHRARIDYLTRLFRARGLPTAAADARARICYAAYLGNLQLLHLGESGRGGKTAFRAELLAMIDAPAAQ